MVIAEPYVCASLETILLAASNKDKNVRAGE